MSSLIISSASRSSPRIFIYHSSHIILIPSSFHSIILAFFTFPLIHFTMVLFAISSKLIFTISFIIPSSSLFHPPFLPISPPSPSSPHIPAFHSLFASMFLSIHFHPFPSHSSSHHFNHTHSYPFPFQSSHSIPFHHSHSFAISLLTLHSHTFNGFLPFIFHRSHSFHPFLFSFLYLPSYTPHSYLFFATLLRILL